MTFADFDRDPFFASPFGEMDKMMSQMRKEMMRPAEFGGAGQRF